VYFSANCLQTVMPQCKGNEPAVVVYCQLCGKLCILPVDEAG